MHFVFAIEYKNMNMDFTNIRKAISWINMNRLFFNPLTNPHDLYAKKMFGELQLMLLVGQRCKRHLSEDVVALLEELKDFSEAIINAPEYYEQIYLDLRNFRVTATSIIYFLCYNNNPLLEEVVRRNYKRAFYVSPELLPYRLLDLEHTVSLTKRYTGVLMQDKINSDVYKTILSSSYDIINWGIEEEYAFTHSIFYATDFGRYSLPVDLLEKVKTNIAVLASMKILDEDYDLLGEYIINMCNLNILTEFREFAYDVLVKQQTADGFFRGPFRKGMNKLNESVEDELVKNKNIVRNNYHTTLVAIMAAVYIKSIQ